MSSPNDLARIRRRHDALWAVRTFFVERGFLELDTPLLVPAPGLEPHIDPLAVDVRTTLDGQPERRWLITSPELALKRALAALSGAGAPKIFQLGHVFRDGERTRRHLPEFTMLEWYRAGAEGGGTIDALVEDAEALCAAVAKALGVAAPPTPFRRTTVEQIFAEHARVDLRDALVRMRDGDARALVRAVEATGEVLRPGADFEDVFFHVMMKAEDVIGRDRPVVVERWPAQMAVLARRCDDDPLFATRFEIYAGGLELANAFDELTDPVEQRARFLDDNAARRALGKAELPLDEAFLSALGALPRSAGCALGIDRLLMFLLGARQIDDVTALPWR
jgi:lysyl-tRNA synthetase class 2